MSSLIHDYKFPVFSRIALFLEEIFAIFHEANILLRVKTQLHLHFLNENLAQNLCSNIMTAPRTSRMGTNKMMLF